MTNPYPIFVEFNKIEWNKAHADKYLSLAKHPEDFEELLDDLLLLGKRDVSNLIKWRDKIVKALNKQESSKKFTKKLEDKKYTNPEVSSKSLTVF